MHTSQRASAEGKKNGARFFWVVYVTVVFFYRLNKEQKKELLDFVQKNRKELFVTAILGLIFFLMARSIWKKTATETTCDGTEKREDAQTHAE